MAYSFNNTPEHKCASCPFSSAFKQNKTGLKGKPVVAPNALRRGKKHGTVIDNRCFSALHGKAIKAAARAAPARGFKILEPARRMGTRANNRQACCSAPRPPVPATQSEQMTENGLRLFFIAAQYKTTDLYGHVSRRCAATETDGRKNSLRLFLSYYTFPFFQSFSL